ncbi:glycosyltransferase [Bacillus pacificus]
MLQPSRQEGLPRALIEAMSRGLPALGARTAGIPELLESEFIFSNTKKNIDEICAILKKFNNEVMIAQSNRNYIEAKKYDKEVIETRRKNFFKKFASSLGDR